MNVKSIIQNIFAVFKYSPKTGLFSLFFSTLLSLMLMLSVFLTGYATYHLFSKNEFDLQNRLVIVFEKTEKTINIPLKVVIQDPQKVSAEYKNQKIDLVVSNFYPSLLGVEVKLLIIVILLIALLSISFISTEKILKLLSNRERYFLVKDKDAVHLLLNLTPKFKSKILFYKKEKSVSGAFTSLIFLECFFYMIDDLFVQFDAWVVEENKKENLKMFGLLIKKFQIDLE